MVKKMSQERIIEEAKETKTLNSILWMTYDAADTYFSQLIISLAYTPFALLLGIQIWGSYTVAFVVMSVFMAFSNLMVAVFGPILGSMSDLAGKRKGAVMLVAIIMIGTSALISLLPTTSNWSFWLASVLFVIANFCYQLGRMFYDAQIPFIAEPKNRVITQAVGGAIAPLGSILAVVTNMLVVGYWGQPTTISSAGWDVDPSDYAIIEFGGLRYLFVVGAVVIFIMAFPYIFHKEVQNPQAMSLKQNWKESRKVFRSTGREIIRDRNSVVFFLAWFFITDAANTAILYMSPIIQGAVGYGSSETLIILIIAIVGSLLFGILTGMILKRVGPKKTFIINALCWIAGILFVAMAGWNILGIDGEKTKWLMFVGGVFIGAGFGGIWIVGRQWITILAPPSKLTQYGGFQKIAGRVSAIVSPILFSVVMFASAPALGTHHAYRVALGQLFLFFTLGMILLFLMIDPYKRYDAGERAPYKDLYVKIPK
jgi:UMF1 family MFS transporter